MGRQLLLPLRSHPYALLCFTSFTPRPPHDKPPHFTNLALRHTTSHITNREGKVARMPLRRFCKPSTLGRGSSMGRGSSSKGVERHKHTSSLFFQILATVLLFLALLFHAQHQQPPDSITQQQLQQQPPPPLPQKVKQTKETGGVIEEASEMTTGVVQAGEVQAATLRRDQEKGRIKKWGCHLSTTPVIFYHVPKTGGGSVRQALSFALDNTSIPICWTCVPVPVQQYYCPGRTFQEIHSLCPPLLGLLQAAPGPPGLSEVEEEGMRAWREGLVMGHYDYGFEYAFLPPPPVVGEGGEVGEEEDEEDGDHSILRVVQLRHPASRVTSEYLFSKASSLPPSPSSPSYPADSSLVLASFLPHLHHYDNWIWKRLAVKYQIADRHTIPCLRGVAIPVLRLCGHTCIPRLITCEMTQEQALEKAIVNLKRKFAVVGVTEEMGKFFQMLGRRVDYLGKLETMDLESVRIHENDKELSIKLKEVMGSEEGQRALRASLVVQQEDRVYEAAREVMNEQWEEELGGCAVEVKEVKEDE